MKRIADQIHTCGKGLVSLLEYVSDHLLAAGFAIQVAIKLTDWVSLHYLPNQFTWFP